MSETLQTWLKNDCGFEVPVKSFEKEFSNGILFGKILSKFGLANDINTYYQDNDDFLIQKNFKKLNVSLQNLNIHLDKDYIDSIMNEELGASGRLLYKIKTQLARKKISFDDIMLKTTTSLAKWENFSKTFQEPLLPSLSNTQMTNKGRTSYGKIILKPLNSTAFSQKALKTKEALGTKNNLNEIIEEDGPNSIREDDNESSQHLSQLGITSSNFSKFGGPRLSFYDNSNYCNYNSLDNNLMSLGIDVKAIDPKLKKYGVGERQMFIPTDIVMKKIKEKVNLERTQKEEEKKLKKIPTEQERLLAKSIISKNKIRYTEENKNYVSTTVLIPKNSKTFKQMQYEKIRKKKFTIRTNRLHSLIPGLTFNSPNHYLTSTFFSQADSFQPETFFTTLHSESVDKRIKNFEQKLTKREEIHPYIERVVELILNLTDKCADYQHEKNCELVQIPEWKEWMEQFIGGVCTKKQIRNTKLYITDEDDENEKFRREEESIKKNYLCEATYDELYDYITYRGEFDFSTIPSKVLNSQIRVYDVLGDNIATLLANGKLILQGVKPSLLKTMDNDGFEMKNEEKENIVIPKANVSNLLFGELLEINFDNSYKEPNAQAQNQQNLEKFDFSFLPIKLCFIGHLFAGKKTQAELLCQEFPNLKSYSIKSIIQRGMEIYEKVNTPIEAHPKFKSLKKNQIEQIEKEKRELKENNIKLYEIIEPYAKKEIEDISNENKTMLLLEEVSKDFPFKDNNAVIEEFTARNNRKAEIEKQLELIAEEQKKKPKAKVKEEQALKAELEKLNKEPFTGFIFVDFPETYEQFILFEKIATGYVQEIDKSENPKEKLIQDLTFLVDKLYHCSSSAHDEAKKGHSRLGFFDKYIWIEANEEETIRRVSNRKKDPNTNIIYHMEDNPPPPNDKKLNERLVDVTEPTIEQVKEELKNFDESFPKVIEFLSLFSKLQKVEKIKKEEILDDIKEIGNSLVKAFEDIEGKDIIADINNNAPVNTDYEDENMRYMKRLKESKMKVTPGQSEQIISQWNEISEKYVDFLRETLYRLGFLKEKFISHMGLIQNGFRDYLNQPSGKPGLLQVFISKYNSFSREYHSILKNKDVFTNFLNDLRELRGHFWSIIRMKKKSAIVERAMIIKNGFVEKQVGVFWGLLEGLFKIETKKLIRTLNIIRHFYYSFDPNKQQDQNPFLYENDLKEIFNNLETLDIIDDKRQKSPKIEKLYKNCIKLLFEYDLFISKVEAQLKASVVMNTSGVSTMSMRRKRGNSSLIKLEASIFSEAKGAISSEEEIKASISNEKNKYKLRITFLKFFGLKYIKELYQISDATFTRLDDWIIESVKTQNDVMNTLMEELKEKIEAYDSKLTYNMELDNFDIYKNAELEFSKRKFVKGEKLSQGEKSYDIEELLNVYNEMKLYEIQKDYIIEDKAIDILLRKSIINQKSSSFSSAIKELPYGNLIKFIEKFVNVTEKGRKIMKNTRIFSLLSIIHCEIMTEQEENDVLTQVEPKLKYHCYLSQEDFNEVKLWFEKENDEGTNKKIKQFLFEINKNYNNEINFVELVNIFRLKYVTLKENVDEEHITYYDILFN